ncbi:unnamed protein product [Strongylus vulgaris]|uniref:C-type lectin domain-containing protein n=1 Tax=Strongylus vulgaris TaxID=40348 RepID=A0A3P7JVA3_STRVU|nr:unnamed protein product [Strongylus vulgaris]
MMSITYQQLCLKVSLMAMSHPPTIAEVITISLHAGAEERITSDVSLQLYLPGQSEREDASAPVLISSARPEILSNTQIIQHQVSFGARICTDGWIRRGESCYHIEMEKMDFISAKMRCRDENATIFKADSLDEWSEIMKLTPHYWTWIGLVQEYNETKLYGVVDLANISILFMSLSRNWLMKPFSPTSNGWSPTSKCAAYHNRNYVALNYVHFYPCNNQYHSICKKNIGFHV